MDEELHVIYINEKVNREEWRTFEVGKTRFTDEALRQTGNLLSLPQFASPWICLTAPQAKW